MSESKIVMVTGCTSGIGLGVSRYLHEHGYRLLLVGRNEEKLKNVSEETGGEPYIICNFEDNAQISRIFDISVEKGIKLIGMVHCAGCGSNVPIRSLHEDDVKKQMQIHYYAFLELCKNFYRRNVSMDGASIVVMSSFATLTKKKGSVPYAAAKSAVNTAVSVASKEFLKRFIRVNAILPAYVDTPMNDGLEELLDVCEVQPMGLIPPEAIAELTEFLLSDKSKYITGALIPVSAGMEVN